MIADRRTLIVGFALRQRAQHAVCAELDGVDDVARVAHDRHVRQAVLADLGRVDVGVDHLGFGCERVELAGHPVVEAGAKRDADIAGRDQPLNGRLLAG